MTTPAVFTFWRTTDNVATLATWAAEASADPAYPATNLPLMTDLDRGNPGKLTIKTAGGWVGTFPGLQRIDGVLLIHNADAGQQVQIQGNDTSSFTTPKFTVTITLPAVREDGYHVKSFIDLTPFVGTSYGTVGYVTAGYQYWRIHFLGTNVTQNWGLKIAMSPINRTLDRALLKSNHMPEHHRIIKLTTDFGYTWRYDLQDAPRALSGQILLSQQGTSWADVLSLYRSAGGPYAPWFIQPDQTLAEGWVVYFGTVTTGDGVVLDQLDVTMIDRSVNPVAFAIEEASFGGPEWT